jgi:DNA topoisomerase-1
VPSRSTTTAAPDTSAAPGASAAPDASAHAISAARAARLRHVNDDDPGITRRRRGERFVYDGPDGRRVRDAETLVRIRALAIPPAWTDVWICPIPNGHIQATGRDARGRKQYRYHARWREVRDENKYDRMIEVGEALPGIRERVDNDLGRSGLPREKVLAAVVRLLELTFLRVGNEEYARLNRSFGLTTLRDRHVAIEGSRIGFRFRGKSGKVHESDIRDRRLARIVRACQDLPGQTLFQYVDDAGERQTIGSDDVNAYLREVSGEDITAKDFRTWAGTVLAFRALCALDPAASDTDAKRNLVAAIKEVAGQLGNTPAVCRKSYVHPDVIEAYLDGDLGAELAAAAEASGQPGPGTDPDEEAAVLELLRRRVLAPAGARAPTTRPATKAPRETPNETQKETPAADRARTRATSRPEKRTPKRAASAG